MLPSRDSGCKGTSFFRNLQTFYYFFDNASPACIPFTLLIRDETVWILVFPDALAIVLNNDSNFVASVTS